MRRQINLSKLKTRRIENGLGQPGPSAFSVGHVHATCCDICISGLVVEYIVAIDVTWVRFPADALLRLFSSPLAKSCVLFRNKHAEKFAQGFEYQSRHQLARVNYQRSGAVVSVLGS